jgi:hypothetical protein
MVPALCRGSIGHALGYLALATSSLQVNHVSGALQNPASFEMSRSLAFVH